MTSTTLYVATNLAARESDAGKNLPRDITRAESAYRLLDAEYYAWLRSRMTAAKKAFETGRLPPKAFDHLRRRFNVIHEWALDHIGEKALLVAVNTMDPKGYEPPCPDQTGPFKQKWVVIESDLLSGERIVLALDERHVAEARARYPKRAVYSPSEIEELDRESGGDPEFIKQAHLLKREFVGEIVPREKWEKIGLKDGIGGETHGSNNEKIEKPTSAPPGIGGENPAPGQPARGPARLGILRRQREPVPEQHRDSKIEGGEGLPDVSERGQGPRQATLLLQPN